MIKPIFKSMLIIVMFIWAVVLTEVFQQVVISNIWVVGALLLAWMPTQK